MKAKIISLVCASFLTLSSAYATQMHLDRQAANKSATHADLLYTQMADSASLKLNPDHQSATLTLNQVDNKTTWFTDRPERQGGVINTAKFISEWQAGGTNSFQ